MTTTREPISSTLDEAQLRKSLADYLKQIKGSSLKNPPIQDAEALLKNGQATKEALQAQINRMELLAKHSESLKKIKSMIPSYKTAITELREQTNKLEALRKELEATGSQLAELQEINELLTSSKTFFGNGFEDTLDKERDCSASSNWQNPDYLVNVALKLEALSLTIPTQHRKLLAYNQSHTLSAIKEKYSQQVEQLFQTTRGEFVKLAEHFRLLEKKAEASPAIKETLCAPLEQEIKKHQTAFNTLRDQFDQQSTSILGIKNDDCSLSTFLAIKNKLAALSQDIRSTANKVAAQDKTVTEKQTAKKNLQEKAANARAAAEQLSNLIAKVTDNSNQLQARDILLYTLYQNHHIECDKAFTNCYSVKELVKTQRAACSNINQSLHQEYDELDQLDKYIKNLPDDMLTAEQYAVCVAKQEKLEETVMSIHTSLKEVVELQEEQTLLLNKAERDLKSAREMIASRRLHYTIDTDPAVRIMKDQYDTAIKQQEANKIQCNHQQQVWTNKHADWIKTLRKNFKKDVKKTEDDIDKAIKDDEESISSKIIAFFAACLPFVKNSTQEALKTQKQSIQVLSCIYDEHCDDLEEAITNPYQPMRHTEQSLRTAFESVPLFKKSCVYLANTAISFLDKKRTEHHAQLQEIAQNIQGLAAKQEQETHTIQDRYTKQLEQDEGKITELLNRSLMTIPKTTPITPRSTPRRISEEQTSSSSAVSRVFDNVSTLFAAPTKMPQVTITTSKAKPLPNLFG